MNNYADYIYPQTGYANNGALKSHAEFLHAGSLRFRIAMAMHDLSVSQLEQVLEVIENFEPVLTDSGEK